MKSFMHYLQYQKELLELLVGARPAGQFVDTRKDDIWLVSYPKSGNTWLRFLLGNLFADNPVDFLSLEDLIPDIHVNSLWRLSQMESPRILKSHYSYDWRYRKVIYIVRDPRDVVISYWMHQKKARKIPLDLPIELFGIDFVKGNLPYGSWCEHVGSWFGARNNTNDFLLIRYEDLLENTMGVLESILNAIEQFPGIKRDFRLAIFLSNFDRMKELEQKQQSRWKPIKKSLYSLNFVREGKSGQWRNTLPRSLLDSIWDQWGDLMRQMGYSE